MRGGLERTQLLDDVAGGQAQELADTVDFSPADVWPWFDDGADDARIIALGPMLGDEDLRDFFCALDAIEQPRSLFEQYYGLRVAREMIPELNSLERDWLRGAVSAAQRAQHVRRDPPAMAASTDILQALQREGPTDTAR